MDSFTKITTLIHVSLGALSLILFWLPVFTRKGSKLHRKIGNIYVYLMWGVVITAAMLSVKNFIIGEITAGLFLGFLTLITGNPLWYGVAILKNKKGVSKAYKQTHFAFNLIIIAFSLIMLGYAFLHLQEGTSVLMIFFGILGLSSAPQILNDYRTKLAGVSWFKEHYQGMVISGTAAYTAFFAFGGRQFMSGILTGYWQILPWILPTILTVIGLRYTRTYYEKKGVLKPAKKMPQPATQS